MDPIPVEALRQEIRETMQDWGAEIRREPERFDNCFYQSFIVLSYCRMWHDWHRGAIGSKRDGAEWAKARLDSRWHGLIDRTWGERPNPEITVRQPADPRDFASTLRFVEVVLQAVNRDAAASAA